ncbi:hypothetical protein RB195_015682 [Necator americanus]|uniref:Secreted protein n=1 Tax=Necator americanus TaxID=51031 RepID=A0ABR1E8C9_NECAM
MFPLALATVFAVIFATVDAEHGALQTRHRRQYSYSLYYFCGSYPNQYLSYYLTAIIGKFREAEKQRVNDDDDDDDVMMMMR